MQQTATYGDLKGTVEAAAPQVGIINLPLPDPIAGVNYSYQLQGSGGTSPYTFTASSLPSGATLSSSGLYQIPAASLPAAGQPINFGNLTITDSGT